MEIAPVLTLNIFTPTKFRDLGQTMTRDMLQTGLGSHCEDLALILLKPFYFKTGGVLFAIDMICTALMPYYTHFY